MSDDNDPEVDFRPKKKLPTGCLISLLILASVFFFIVAVCSRA